MFPIVFPIGCIGLSVPYRVYRVNLLGTMYLHALVKPWDRGGVLGEVVLF